MRKLALVFALLFALDARAQSTATITIQGIPLPTVTISEVTPKRGYVGTAMSAQITGTGFSATCKATVNGISVPFTAASAVLGTIAIPDGVVVNGNNPVVLTCTAPILSLNVPVTLPTGKVGVAYSADLATVTGLAGGTPPYFFEVSSGTLPRGLTLTPQGLLSGVPTSLGSSSFAFTVKDSSGMELRSGSKGRVRVAKN